MTKKRTTRRRTYRRKTPKSGVCRIVRWSNNNTTSNCHLELVGTVTGLPVSPSTGNGVETFSLANVAGSAEITSLFDNYRINKVVYRWVLLRDPVAGPAGNGQKGIYPRITWKHDFNDTATITRTQMYQNANMREVFMNENFQRTKWYTLLPAVTQQVYESAVSTSYSPKWRQFLDTNDSTCPHNGIKYNVTDLYDGVALRLEAKIFLECKGIS